MKKARPPATSPRPPLPPVPVSAELRRAMLDHPGSTYALAADSGISRASLARFLSRERSLTLPSVDRICGVLGLRLISRPGRNAGSNRPQAPPVATPVDGDGDPPGAGAE